MFKKIITTAVIAASLVSGAAVARQKEKILFAETSSNAFYILFDGLYGSYSVNDGKGIASAMVEMTGPGYWVTRFNVDCNKKTYGAAGEKLEPAKKNTVGAKIVEEVCTLSRRGQ